jgi:hypothetical protein
MLFAESKHHIFLGLGVYALFALLHIILWKILKVLFPHYFSLQARKARLLRLIEKGVESYYLKLALLPFLTTFLLALVYTGYNALMAKILLSSEEWNMVYLRRYADVSVYLQSYGIMLIMIFGFGVVLSIIFALDRKRSWNSALQISGYELDKDEK